MSAGKPFKIYRVICTITGRALVSGSELPNNEGPWYERGQWTQTGVFWKTEATIKRHIWKLCHDWRMSFAGGAAWYFDGYKRVSEDPDWSRLDHLRVETTTVTDHTTSEVGAKDFMGIQEPEVVAEQ